LAEGEDLDARLRQADPDRWLTSRFVADPAARADLVVLYAFDAELARARRIASQPLIGEIRLTWWREVLDEIDAGGLVRRHPVAEALAEVVRRRRLERQALEAMIDGQIELLGAAILSAAEAVAFADAVEGSAARLAAAILDPASPPEAAGPAGRAWGLALVFRAGLAPADTIRPPLRAALAEGRTAARRLSVSAFPAALPARLARYDLLDRTPDTLEKQLSLVLAAVRGRI